MDQVTLKIRNEFDNLTIKEVLKCFNIGKGRIEEIRVNKSFALNNETKTLESVCHKGDTLSFFLNEKIDFKPYFIHLDVVYEDDYMLIVNKPSGMLIHPDNENNNETLVNVVAGYYYEHKIFRAVRPVHRIDFETSGIVIFAKDFLTQGKLEEQIQKNELKRSYLALCHNKFKTLKDRIDMPIGKDRHENNKFRCARSTQSKTAITNYEVIKEYKGYSLVNLLLETGRTHQIRVHMSYLNHPLLGDSLYGGKKEKINRVALHSYEVKFLHPITNEYLDLVCVLPLDMKELVK